MRNVKTHYACARGRSLNLINLRFFAQKLKNPLIVAFSYPERGRRCTEMYSGMYLGLYSGALLLGEASGESTGLPL